MATFAERRSKTTAGSHSETRLSRHHARSLGVLVRLPRGQARPHRDGVCRGWHSSGRDKRPDTCTLLAARFAIVRCGCIPRRSQPRRRRRRRRRRRASVAVMTSQERFSVHSQLEHLQAKYVGTGHADTTKLCAPDHRSRATLFLRTLPPALTVACRRLVAVSGRSTSIETPTRFTAGWTR